MSALPTPDPFRPTPRRLHWDPVRFRAVCTEPVHLDLPRFTSEPLPEPGEWATRIARATVECLYGLRPSHQLTRWLAPAVFDALTERITATAKMRHSGHVVRVRHATISEVDSRTCEAACTVFDGERFRACAMRMREYRGRWLVVALEIG